MAKTPERSRKSKRNTALALTPRAYRIRLAQARTRFNRVLGEEEGRTGVRVPAKVKQKWRVGRDWGTYRTLWQKVKGVPAPLPLAGDIIKLQDRRSGRQTEKTGYFHTEKRVIDDMMSPREAHALPVFDADGQHLATVIHVGPDATQAQMRRLARELIRDPTGKSGPSF